SLERLESLCQRRLLRIGLSATQKPISMVADFLVGARSPSPLRGDDCMDAGGRAMQGAIAEGRGEGSGSRESNNEAVSEREGSTHTRPSPQSSPPNEIRAGGEEANAKRDVTIIDTGHTRPRDLAIEVPPVPLEAVMSNDCWELVYDRLAQL